MKVIFIFLGIHCPIKAIYCGYFIGFVIATKPIFLVSLSAPICCQI